MFSMCWRLFSEGAAAVPPHERADLSDHEARLLGYLADVIAQSMNPVDRDGLRRLAKMLRPAAERGHTDLGDARHRIRPVVPGQDPLARQWAVAPALDLNRLRAEWHGLVPVEEAS